MSRTKHFIFKTHWLLTAVSRGRMLSLNPFTDEKPESQRYGLTLQMSPSNAGTLLMSDWFRSLLLPASECWLSSNDHDDNSSLSAYRMPNLCFLFKISSNLHANPHFTDEKTEAKSRKRRVPRSHSPGLLTSVQSSTQQTPLSYIDFSF